MSISRFIDHTILKPSTTEKEIEQVCEEAMDYNFAAVCIPPYFIRKAKTLLMNNHIAVATVIGFPFGYSHYNSKLYECEYAIAEGVDELDMVMNITAFKDGNLEYLANEIEPVSRFAVQAGKILKVICETGILSDAEIIRCCEFYRHFPIDFLKTSTGYAEKGASVNAVRLMRAHLPPEIAIKASGGIRSYEFAAELIDAGAERLGCSASVAIVKEEKGENLQQKPEGY